MRLVKADGEGFWTENELLPFPGTDWVKIDGVSYAVSSRSLVLNAAPTYEPGDLRGERSSYVEVRLKPRNDVQQSASTAKKEGFTFWRG